MTELRGKRRGVYARDGGACHYCPTVTTYEDGTIDHVWPQALGGVHAQTNLVWSCYPCNIERDNSPVKCACDFCAAAREAHGYDPARHNPRRRLSALGQALLDAGWEL